MIKSAPTEVASTKEMGTRLTTGAATRPSFFYKGGTGVYVPTSGAFSTVGDADNDDDYEENLLLDAAATTTASGERTSDERGILWMHHLWINFFFVILAMARLKKMKVAKTITKGPVK
jgi:hypothetical protein